ncbi:hypothetical protein BJX65DRAFT_120344 [Aspergillus insuetus]
MRTRSQPASPGGFVSLETEQTTTRRVTRSTRAASRAASQEPSSQQAIEPTTEPATRPKSQRKIKKPVSRKTAATTTSSTTSTAPSTTPITTSTTLTTEPQTRKAPKRGTRKTTRKTQKATSDETDSNAETIIESTHDNEDRATDDIEISASVPQNMALMEPNSSSREYRAISPSRVPLPSFPLSSTFFSPLSFPLSLPSPPISSSPFQLEEHPTQEDHPIRRPLEDISSFEAFQARQEAEVPLEFGPLDDLGDLYFNLPDLGDTPCPAWDELDPAELYQLETAISRPNSPLNFELHLDDDVLAQINEALVAHHAEENSTIAGPVPSTSVQVNTTESIKPNQPEQSIEQPKTVSVVASAVDEEETAVEDTSFNNLFDILAESFAKLSFDVSHLWSEEAAVSSESTTTPVRLPETKPAADITTSAIHQTASQPALEVGASVAAAASLTPLLNAPEPNMPTFSLFAPPKRVPLTPRTIFSLIPETPSSIFGAGESAQQQLAPVVSVEEESGFIADPPSVRAKVPPMKPRASRAQRRRLMHVTPAPLSPIPEEEVDFGTRSSAGHLPDRGSPCPVSDAPLVHHPSSLSLASPASPPSASPNSPSPFALEETQPKTIAAQPQEI